jgi:hypothetical protein
MKSSGFGQPEVLSSRVGQRSKEARTMSNLKAAALGALALGVVIGLTRPANAG